MLIYNSLFTNWSSEQNHCTLLLWLVPSHCVALC